MSVRVCRQAIIAIVVFAAAFAAHGQQPADKLRPLSIGVASLCSCWLPLYVADSHGLFKEQGLDAKVITFSGGSQSMAALASNDIQIVGGSGVRGFTARAQGLDTLAVLSQSDQFYLQFMAVDKDIKSIKDLKGKQISVRPGALTEQLLKYLVKREGIESSVQIVGTPTEPAEAALVQRRAVDAVMTTEPNATFYVANKLATPVINFNDPEEVKKNGLGDLVPSHTLTYLAREAWLAQPGSDDLTRRFVAAMQKSLALIRKDPDTAIKTWQALGGVAKDDPKVIADSIRTTISSFSPNGCSTRQGMDNLQKIVLAIGQIKQPIPYDKLATNKYFAPGVCAN